jgi:AraC-like DNA-binding protein
MLMMHQRQRFARRPCGSAHPWTIASLAKEAGASCSVLAERFRRHLQLASMAYLTRWRLQLRAQMLASTNHSVAQIAPEAGYESEAAFNRAFIREFTVPPTRFRSQSRSSTKSQETPFRR